MLEISWLNTKKKKRIVLWIGHGLPCHGQIDRISIIIEYLSPNGDETYNAKYVWHWGRRINR